MESLANPVGVGAHHKGERPASSVPVRIVMLMMSQGSTAIDHAVITLAPAVIASMRSMPEQAMIRKPASGEFRLCSRKKDPRTGKRCSPGTSRTRATAEKHDREVQCFKRNG